MPRPSAALARVSGLSEGLLRELTEHRQVRAVTLDVDATIVSSGKREARFTYRAATGEVRGGRRGISRWWCIARSWERWFTRSSGTGTFRRARIWCGWWRGALRRLPECVEEVTGADGQRGVSARVGAVLQRPRGSGGGAWAVRSVAVGVRGIGL